MVFLEYNPKLSEVPRGARVAYAKFMTKKLHEDYIKEGEEEEKIQEAVSLNLDAQKSKYQFFG